MASAPTENRDLVAVGPVKFGRPSVFEQHIADEICERISVGESLNAICKDDHMPDRATVNRWLLDVRHEEFRANYATSRQLQADAFADQVHDIADNLGLLPEHKRVMIDARKWRAARQNWRAWGDKISHEHAHTVHPAHEAERIPTSVSWLAQFLPGHEADERPEPDTGGVGEE